jgi:hypothetical protein
MWTVERLDELGGSARACARAPDSKRHTTAHRAIRRIEEVPSCLEFCGCGSSAERRGRGLSIVSPAETPAKSLRRPDGVVTPSQPTTTPEIGRSRQTFSRVRILGQEAGLNPVGQAFREPRGRVGPRGQARATFLRVRGSRYTANSRTCRTVNGRCSRSRQRSMALGYEVAAPPAASAGARGGVASSSFVDF